MKFISLLYFFLCSFILSSAAIAKDVNQTPFEVLKDFHQSVGVAVNWNQLNEYNLDSKVARTVFRKCVYAEEETNLLQTNFSLFTVTEVIPGTPSNGPVFPGKPEQRFTRTGVMIGEPSKMTRPYAINQQRGTRWDFTQMDKTIYYKDRNDPEIRIEIKLHKNDLISFSEHTLIADEHWPYPKLVREIYGYCWNE